MLRPATALPYLQTSSAASMGATACASSSMTPRCGCTNPDGVGSKRRTRDDAARSPLRLCPQTGPGAVLMDTLLVESSGTRPRRCGCAHLDGGSPVANACSGAPRSRMRLRPPSGLYDVLRAAAPGESSSMTPRCGCSLPDGEGSKTRGARLGAPRSRMCLRPPTGLYAVLRAAAPGEPSSMTPRCGCSLPDGEGSTTMGAHLGAPRSRMCLCPPSGPGSVLIAAAPGEPAGIPPRCASLVDGAGRGARLGAPRSRMCLRPPTGLYAVLRAAAPGEPSSMTPRCGCSLPDGEGSTTMGAHLGAPRSRMCLCPPSGPGSVLIAAAPGEPAGIPPRCASLVDGAGRGARLGAPRSRMCLRPPTGLYAVLMAAAPGEPSSMTPRRGCSLPDGKGSTTRGARLGAPRPLT